MYFITTKRMLEVCFSAHPNIQYRTGIKKEENRKTVLQRLIPLRTVFLFRRYLFDLGLRITKYNDTIRSCLGRNASCRGGVFDKRGFPD